MNQASDSSALQGATPLAEAPGPEGVPVLPKGVRMTSRAAKVMREQLLKRGTPNAIVRFGIRGGGCTGYSYLFEFDDKGPRAHDSVSEKDGVVLAVDPKSMFYLEGTEIDFETGIRGHGFKFDNPNVDDSCGCGESIAF